MNVLFIAPYVPSRIRVRPFHIIKELARNNRVYAIVLGEADGSEYDGVDEIRSIVEDLKIIPHSKLRGYAQSLLAVPTPQPMCVAFCRSRAMENAIKDALLEIEFDLIHVEHLRAAQFAPLKNGLPIVFDSVDCLSGLFRQMSISAKNPLSKLVMKEEAWKLKSYEPRILKRFDRIIITSESERSELISLDKELRIDVVPNGVDTEYFTPLGSDRNSKRIVFSGKMSYSPNANAVLWFMEKCFYAIKEKMPDVEFVVVGSEPPPEIRKLEEIPGIKVTGYVDDIRPYLDSASLAIAPMQVAVGIQNKVLEAMAMGLPVVASSAAVRPFGQNCPGIIEANSSQAMTDEIINLLHNPELANKIGLAGRNEVSARFSWKASVNLLENIYKEAISAKKAQ